MQVEDLYEWLGVPPMASAETVKETYLQRARTMHPDKGGDAAQFAELNRVCNLLVNPATRKIYDGALKVSNKFPELCGLCDGVGRRHHGISGWKECPRCKGLGRYVAVIPAKNVGQPAGCKPRVSLKLKKPTRGAA